MNDKLNSIPASDPGLRVFVKLTSRNLVKRIWPIVVILISAFFGIYFYNLFFPPPMPPSQSDIDESISQAINAVTPIPAYSSQVYQTILPSIVYIQTHQEDPKEEGFGVGSGVIINENGDILTALHVVSEASKIEVIFIDGSRAIAETIASEPENDMAILRPNRLPEIIVPAVLGSSMTMRVGDEAYAVGNPMGLVASLSAGVISGFNRSIPTEDGEKRLEGLIQFDTAVNPGNSGGPLLNRQGQVIGIVTALANPSEQNFFIGIGFAVPIGTAVSAVGGPEY